MRAALRLVWTLDARHLAAHKARLVLSVLGVAVGVALVVAVGTLSSSITGSLEAIARAAATDANVEVRPNGDTGLSPSLLAEISTHESVEAAGATVESNVRLRSPAGEARVLALGVDVGVLQMSPEAVDLDAFSDVDPLGLFVPPPVADELGVATGDRIEIITPHGWQEVGVSTVLQGEQQQRSRVVVAGVGVLQDLLGRGESYDAIYVKASDPEGTIAALQASVGPAATVGPIALRDERIGQLLAAADTSFTVGVVVALFVGAFLVYNTMSMAAVERLREAAVMRAVGAKRRQVFALFCAEGGLLGLVGSVAGVAGGLVMSRVLLVQRGGALEEIYPVLITRVTVDPRVLVLATAAGVVASVAAAVLPARRVARSDPAPALGATGALEDPLRRQRRSVVVAGVACLVLGPSIAVPSVAGGYGTGPGALGGMVVTLAGIGLLIPVVVPRVAAWSISLVARLRSVPGSVRLGAEEVLRSPGRTAYTVGAVLLSLSLVVAFSVAQTSMTRAFDTQFQTLISADLYVRSPTWRPLGSDVRMDAGLATEIEEMEGVAGAWPFRLMPATHRDRSILVLAYDLERFARLGRFDEADRREALEASQLVGSGMNMLASPSVFSQLGYELGETVEMDTPTGRHEIRIVGTIDDPVAINPEFVFEYETFVQLWGTGGADTIGVVVSDGVDPLEVRESLAARFGDTHGVEVDTNEYYMDRLSSVVGSVQQLVSSVQFVAVLVAALGLANTLLISTLERKRDLGVLRAVGMLRRQLRRMVAVEALAMGAIGVALAWVLGTVIGAGMYAVIRAQLGLAIPLVLPPLSYAFVGLLGLAAAFFASLYPASRAARADVVEALQYE
jgi:putative ABC transport system permease protein